MSESISRPETLEAARDYGRGKQPNYKQLLVMQDIMFEAVVNPEIAIDSKPGCVRAWDILEERKRILKGKPLPGVLKPTNAKRGKILRGNAELTPIANLKDGGIDKGFSPDLSSSNTQPVVVDVSPIEPES